MKHHLEILRCLLLLIAVLAQLSDAAFRFGSVRSASRISSSSVRSVSRFGYGISRGVSFATMSLLVRSRFSYRVNTMSYSRGIFFATRSWRTSHSYSDSATLCFNVMDAISANYNSSVVEPWLYQSRTVLGIFVCPMEESGRDKVYCCGEEDRQRCCTFWDDGGRVAGLFCGLGALVVIALIVAYYVQKKYIKNKAAVGSQAQNAPAAPVVAATHHQQQTVAEAPIAMSAPPPYMYPPMYSADPNADINKPAAYDPNYPPAFAPPSYWDPNTGAMASSDNGIIPPVRS